MKTYKVIVASTIYYMAEIEAENEQEIKAQFDNGDLDFTCWTEAELDSHIYDISEIAK